MVPGDIPRGKKNDGLLRVVAFDPSFSNWGIAHATIDLKANTISLDNLKLIQTEANKYKDVRKNSDDLRRAMMLHEAVVESTHEARIVFSEVPTGSQSARASWALGIAVGVLACVRVPIIQLQPTEVKLRTVGSKSASKKEMIEWAMSMYPEANWLTRKSKGKVVPMNSNEHLADAVAVLHAGIQSDQYRQLKNMVSTFQSGNHSGLTYPPGVR